MRLSDFGTEQPIASVRTKALFVKLELCQLIEVFVTYLKYLLLL